ncbi:MAG: hypothetical protein OXH78_04350 [Acidimicrobiaceae bacterium]|nr:hypothetical protein [Acidimicrobiaceae bacterium]
MPTHDETNAFMRDYGSLTAQQQDRFDSKREEFTDDLLSMEDDPRKGFRPGLRVKKVQGESGLFEMTWAPDGRAIFSMGSPVIEGKRHIVWRRVGDHSILP